MTSPTDAAEQFRLGLEAGKRGDLPAAESHFRDAIRLQPDFAQAYNNLGVALERQGKLMGAVEVYGQILRRRPDYAEAHHNQSVAWERMGQYQAAVDSCRRAIALQPGYVQAYNGLGVALHQLGQVEEAVECLRHVVAAWPDYAQGHSNLASILENLGEFEAAIAHLQRAIALEPNSVGPHVNLGLLLEHQWRTPEAEQTMERALALDPRCHEAQVNYCLLLERQSRMPEAEQVWRRALMLDPDCAEAHLGLGLARLRQGDFAGGAKEYLWRFRMEGRPEPSYAQPHWDGSPLAGRTILLCEDQGAGDSIHFVRYAELIAQQGGHVLVQCRPHLVSLLQTCPGVLQAISTAAPLPPFDVFVPMPDLPGLMGTTLATIPANVPYLSGDETHVASWREEWRNTRELKVGISWQGDPQNISDRNRSIPLTHYYELARIPGVKLFSLQFGQGCEQLAQVPAGVTISDLGDRLGDFRQTAAIMQNLDLVITCDSAPAHLAGALGVPVWVALAQLADWRWLLERSDSPWYPSLRLFRQRRFGDWAEVFGRIREELTRVAAENQRGH